MKHLEIECKWEANSPRAFSRAKAFLMQLGGKVTSKKLTIKDTYLEDNWGHLAAQKIALRVRNTDGKWEATFKTRTEIKNGKAVRREENLPLPQAKNVAQALSLLAQKKRWCGVDVRQLNPTFTLANKRTIYEFDYDGATLEMAQDNVTIYVLGRQVKFKEIEVELKKGDAEKLEKFALALTRTTKLKRAKISKVKTAETFLKFWGK